MPLSEEKFSQGMTTEEYFDQTRVNRQPLADIYQAIEIPEETRSFFDGLAQPLRLAVFTADWCGDAVSTTPAILRLAESTGGVWVRVFNRDEELALTNSFLPESRAGTVPVFVVLDPSLGEVARFIETAGELAPAIDAMNEIITAAVAEGLALPAKSRPAVGGTKWPPEG